MDLAALGAHELDQLSEDVAVEQQRRAKLAQLPDQLADMARDAAAAGCDRDDLIERVTDALTSEEHPALEG